VPDEQHDDRADDGAEEAGALVRAIPAYGLADERRDECTGDAEERRQDKARRVVRARRQKARDDSGDKADDDDPNDLHGETPCEATNAADTAQFRRGPSRASGPGTRGRSAYLVSAGTRPPRAL